MMAMKLGWLILVGLQMGFFLYYGSSVALCLTILLIGIPIISLGINLYVRKFLKIKIKTPVNLRKGDNGECLVMIHNPTFFPVLRIRCKIKVENQLNRDKRNDNVMTWLPPKRKQQASLIIGSDYCGRLRICVEQIVLYDCFGVIGIPCKCSKIEHLTVQPDTFEMDVALIPGLHSIEDSELYSQIKAGSDLSETFQIREYVPGDSPRQIHWKLSGKFDKLIVRDPSLPITRNVLVFWERTGESGDYEKIDAQAEVIVSLCQALLDQSIQFTVGWNDTDRGLCILHEIRDMDTLVGVIPRLMRATGVKDGVGGASLLVQTRAEALCSHMVYLAEEPDGAVSQMAYFGHVTSLICGENNADDGIIFSAGQYKDQLDRVEI